jgi:hypothetical protein
MGQDLTSYRTHPRSYKQLDPGPSNAPGPVNDRSDPDTDEDDMQMQGTQDFSYLARDMTEGGHRAISFLLHKNCYPMHPTCNFKIYSCFHRNSNRNG